MKRVLLCAVLMAWSAMASAVVYKWVDASGKTQYGDRPPDGVHAEVVELLGTHTGRAARPPDAAAAPKAAATGDPATQAVKKAVDEDVAQAKDKECADAQDRYKKLIEGRKIYKTGADGERQYLTSDEIDSERINAKREIDTVCNSTT
jgi:Domain of unknown function (DUF4124)